MAAKQLPAERALRSALTPIDGPANGSCTLYYTTDDGATLRALQLTQRMRLDADKATSLGIAALWVENRQVRSMPSQGRRALAAWATMEGGIEVLVSGYIQRTTKLGETSVMECNALTGAEIGEFTMVCSRPRPVLSGPPARTRRGLRPDPTGSRTRGRPHVP